MQGKKNQLGAIESVGPKKADRCMDLVWAKIEVLVIFLISTLKNGGVPETVELFGNRHCGGLLAPLSAVPLQKRAVPRRKAFIYLLLRLKEKKREPLESM